MPTLQSSNLRAAEHDAASGLLIVWFHSGSAYEYRKVPRRVFRELLDAPSAGRYFHAEIRFTYRYRRIQ
jgi:hypothetical protein